MRDERGFDGAGSVHAHRLGRRVEDEERRHVGYVVSPGARRVEVGSRSVRVVRQTGVARGEVAQIVCQHRASPEDRGEECRGEDGSGGAGGGLAHEVQAVDFTQDARPSVKAPVGQTGYCLAT